MGYCKPDLYIGEQSSFNDKTWQNIDPSHDWSIERFIRQLIKFNTL
jgi:hypothetical protein